MNQFVIDPKTHYSIHDRWPSGGQNQSFCAKYCDYKRYQNGKFKMLFMFQTKTTKPPPPHYLTTNFFQKNQFALSINCG